MTNLADILADDLRAKVSREAVDARPIYNDPRQRVQDIYADTLPEEGTSYFTAKRWNSISLDPADDFTFDFESGDGSEWSIEVDQIRWTPTGIAVEWRAIPQ